MMIRMLIVSPQWQRLEALLMEDARCYVLDALPDDSGLPERIRTFCPERMVWQGFPFPAYLRFITATPPKIIELLEGQCPAHPDADAWLRLPVANGTLRDTVAGSALSPLPKLARSTYSLRVQWTAETLHDLGMPENLKGYQYLLHGVAACACAPSLLGCFRDALYPLLSGQFSVTPASVERDIRTAVEVTWLRGDLEGIQRCFGFTVDANRGKPTNTEFISTIAQQIRQRVQRYLEESASARCVTG